MTPRRNQLRRTKGLAQTTGALIVPRPTRWANPHNVAEYGQAVRRKRPTADAIKDIVDGSRTTTGLQTAHADSAGRMWIVLPTLLARVLRWCGRRVGAVPRAPPIRDIPVRHPRWRWPTGRGVTAAVLTRLMLTILLLAHGQHRRGLSR